MYMGHVGIGLGAKRFARAAPLWLLLVAALLPDLVDAVGGLTPWAHWCQTHSHKLTGIAGGAILMGAAAWVIGRTFISALVAALLVVSHLLADFVTSRIAPWPNGPVIGLALYNHHILDFFVEGIVILSGWWLYRDQLPRERQFHWAFFAMLVTLLGFQFLLDGVVGVSG
ncbi:MAG TPA: metal-dependent hydrolase [Candidatus Acidoferrales bacterium]|nr:metal-dependent hydrolase [Candidatus Acidoferrales bacterium]